MKKVKKVLSILLAVIMTVGTTSVGFEGFGGLFASEASGAYEQPLKENADGSFRILQFSDIQDNNYLSAKSLATIRLAIRRYNPNLIVLTGDNVINCYGDDVYQRSVDGIINEFKDSSGNAIPFAVTFGNHDYEVNYHDENKSKKISLREQYEYYLSKGAISLNQTGLDTSAVSSATSDNSATLWGTGYIDVYTNDGSKVARRVILLNTGSYDGGSSKYARVGYNVETNAEESYSNVVNAVNTWTNATNSASEKIKCVVYQHIAMQEIYLGDSPATSILTAPTVTGVPTHYCHSNINNSGITGQYVKSTKNSTVKGIYDEAPKCSYNSTKDLYKALAKDNVLGVFYGHDHVNSVSGETKITYDGTQYTLTQGYGGGIDVYDGNYLGIDPQGSCYVIDKNGNLTKEVFTYTGLLTDDITYPSGDDNIKYISEVVLFNGTSFENACYNARSAGYTPVVKAYSANYNYADLNSNDRGYSGFTGNGRQFECIAYRQTSNPSEAITDLRVFISTDSTYSRTNQTKTYTLNGKTSEYRIVSGCDGNVNYGVTSNTANEFLYYTKNPNAGAPLTELIVELEESNSTDAYRNTYHAALQVGNFVENFGAINVDLFPKTRIANLNWGTAINSVIGDSVYLFLKRYDGCSGYNTKFTYDAVAGVPETIYTSSSNFSTYINNTVGANGVQTADTSATSTGKVYFYCPEATDVTVSATTGDGYNGVNVSSCSVGSFTKSNGVYSATINSGKVSGNGVIKWVFSYTIGSSTKTQIAYSTVISSNTQARSGVDKSALRSFIGNFNQVNVVKNATETYTGNTSFSSALANASYVLGNPSATQDDVDEAKAEFERIAEGTSILAVPDTDTNGDVDDFIEEAGGYIYGICQPENDYLDKIVDTGFNYVRTDIPCPFDRNGKIRSSYLEFRNECLAYKAKGLKVLAVTPYPKDLIADMGINLTSENINDEGVFDDFLETTEEVIDYIYRDFYNNNLADIFQITNEMGLIVFSDPLSNDQCIQYIGVQLEKINEIKQEIHADNRIQVGYNLADLLESSRYINSGLSPYYQYCDYVAIDLYTGNQGQATPKDYSKKVRELYSLTGKPIIITEFGFWSAGGRKTADQKNEILAYYGYNTEAEAIAAGMTFVNKLPNAFRKTLEQNYPDQQANWASLVFSKYSAHFYGETSAETLNDIPHTPDGQAEYFRQVMTELKTVDCLAGLIVYCCEDKETCFNCGHSWCPYETKYGIFNYSAVDGGAAPKPAVAELKELIARFKIEDAKDAEYNSSNPESAKATVTIYHKYGSKAVSCDKAEVFKGSTVVASPKFIPGYTCSSSSVVYANVTADVTKAFDYSPITYTATFSGGTNSDSSFGIDGNDLVLDTPTKNGAVFNGWKVTSVAGSTFNSTSFIEGKVYPAGTYKGMYGNVTFEAQWGTTPYTVTFNANDGTGLSFSSKTVHCGEAYGELPTVTPSSGYFAGWKDGNGTVITSKTICNTAANHTLTAFYSSTKYLVRYDNLFNVEEWSSAGGTTLSKNDGSTAVINAANNSVAITYVNSAGETNSEVITNTNGSSMTIPVTAGTTYRFTVDIKATNATQGWANFGLFVFDNTGHTDVTGQNYVNNNTTSSRTMTYTAPANATKATIRFSNKTTGATITYSNIKFIEVTAADRLDNYISYPSISGEAVAGSAYENLIVPSRPGYAFDGWYSDAALTNKIDENVVASGKITAYSKWHKVHEVTYDNLFSLTEFASSKCVEAEFNGTPLENAQVNYVNGSITVPGPGGTGIGYTKMGTSSDYYTIPVTKGTKYYFSFTSHNWGGRAFIKFASSDLSGISTDLTVSTSGKYLTTNSLGDTAANFLYYFVAPANDNICIRFDSWSGASRTYSNIRLIDEAHYYADSSYNSYFSIIDSSTFGELQTPSRSGYSFKGWYDNASCTGSPITSTSSTGSSNIKLYSKWAVAYDVMYNSIFDFDQWGSKAKTSMKTDGQSATAVVNLGKNSYTIIADSNNTSADVTSGAFNGPNAYIMDVIPGHTYKIYADVVADSSNSESKSFNIFAADSSTTAKITTDWSFDHKEELSYSLAPGESKTFTFTTQINSTSHYLTLRLALKSSGAGKGTFSNIRIQDMTATPYPEAYVQVGAAAGDSLADLTLPANSLGWFDTLNSDGTVSGTNYTSLSSLSANVKLYPKNSTQTYTVTYHCNSSTHQETLVYGADPTSAYIPSVAGYALVGWYTDSDCRTFSPTIVTENIDLYAKLEPVSCNVGYDNIFLMNSQSFTYVNTNEQKLIADKTNKTITMSLYKPSDSGEMDLLSGFIELPATADSDTYYILSADYSISNCQARIMAFFYDASGNACSISHTNDSSHPITEIDGEPNNVQGPIYSQDQSGHHYYVMKVPNGCKKIKLRFDCINTDTSKRRNIVFSNIRLVKKTDNTYISEKAKFSKLESVATYGSTYTLPTASCFGYTFGGWYSDPACTSPVSASTICSATGDHTLYSKWTKAQSTLSFDNNNKLNVLASYIADTANSGWTKAGSVYTKTDGEFTATYNPTTDLFTINGSAAGKVVGHSKADPFFTFIDTLDSKQSLPTTAKYQVNFEKVSGSYTGKVSNSADSEVVPVGYSVLGSESKTWQNLSNNFTKTSTNNVSNYGVKLAIYFYDVTYVTFDNYTFRFSVREANTVSSTQNLTYGDAIPTISSAPQNSGYTFNGYYDAGGTKYYNADLSKAETTWEKDGNSSLYAEWIGKVYYDNLFDVSAWLRKASRNLNSATKNSADYDEANNTISFTTASGKSSSNNYAAINGNYYYIPVKPNTSYTISAEVSGANVSIGYRPFATTTSSGTNVLSPAKTDAATNPLLEYEFRTDNSTNYITVVLQNNTTGTASFKNVRVIETTIYETAKDYPFSADVKFGKGYGDTLSTRTATGYSFAGWKDANGNDIDSASVCTSANTYVFSQWDADSVAIAYDNLFFADKWYEGVGTNGSKVTTVYDSETQSITITSDSDSTDAYTSLDEKYYTMNAESGATYVFQADVTVSAAATVRPLARALNDDNESLKVKELGQINVSANSTYHYNKEWEVPEGTTKIAIRFGTTTGGVTVTYSNIRFVKKSVADKGVTYSKGSENFYYGSEFTNIMIPVKTGYTLTNWNTAEDGSGTAVTPTTVNKFTSDTTLYSQWVPTNYTISYALNGGTNAAGNATGYTMLSNDITINVPTKANNYFNGWTLSGATFASGSVTSGRTAKIASGSYGDVTATASWTQVANEDAFVVDTGLPVKLDVLNNDLDGATIKQITNANGLQVTVEDDYVKFTPSGVISSVTSFVYEDNFSGVSNCTATAYIIPATCVYYEESLITTHDDEEAAPNLKWTDETDENVSQALEELNILTSAGSDTTRSYGENKEYELSGNSAKSSLGKVKSIVLYKGNTNGDERAYAEFTFKGTGFEVNTLISKDTGYVKYKIFKNGVEYKSYVITLDNAYTYGQLYLKDGQLSLDKTGTPLYLNGTGNSYVLQSKTYYDQKGTDGEIAYGWIAAGADDNVDPIYQTPAIFQKDLGEYATYTVRIIPKYSSKYDTDKNNNCKFYFDSFKVYNPLGKTPEGKAAEVYKLDNEYDVRYKCIRDMLKDANSLGSEIIGSTAGVAFIGSRYDGNSNKTVLQEYLAIGPKNEVYLNQGDSIAFTLRTKTSSSSVPDKVSIGMKLAHGQGTGKISIQSGTVKNGYHTNDYVTSISTEQFKNISCGNTEGNGFVWEQENDGTSKINIIITNTSATAIPVSITDIKYSYSDAEAGDIEIEQQNVQQSSQLVLENEELQKEDENDDRELVFYFDDDTIQGIELPIISFDVIDATYFASLTLKDNIDVRLRIRNLGDGFDKDELKIYVDDEELSADNIIYTASEHNVSCVAKSVAPYEMSKPIHIVIIYDDVKINELYYSIGDYCNSVFDAQKNNTTGKYDKLAEVCKAVLNYGKYAEDYANKNTESTVNEDCPIDFSGVTVSAPEKSVALSNKITKAGATISPDSQLSLNFFVYSDIALTKSNVVIVNNLGKYVDSDYITVSEISNDDGFNYKITVDNLYAEQFSRTYTLTVKGDSNFAVTYGVYNYCSDAQKQTDFSNTLKTLCKAIYNYGEASRAYSESLAK